VNSTSNSPDRGRSWLLECGGVGAGWDEIADQNPSNLGLQVQVQDLDHVVSINSALQLFLTFQLKQLDFSISKLAITNNRTGRGAETETHVTYLTVDRD
jgi:hypothetical protein